MVVAIVFSGASVLLIEPELSKYILISVLSSMTTPVGDGVGVSVGSGVAFGLGCGVGCSVGNGVGVAHITSTSTENSILS